MDTNMYNPAVETLNRAEIRSLQSARLVAQVRHAWENIPYYRSLMEKKSVTPDDIHGVEDIGKLPFLCKDDLRECYPYGMLAVPRTDVVRIQSTSGTTGKRVIAFYTESDLDIWSECCARAIRAAGGTRDDIMQIAYGYGLFTGGMGVHGGAQRLGAMTIPMSSGNTDRQIQFIQDLGTTILCCTPSYAAYIGETMEANGIKPSDTTLRIGIFGAEPWTEEMRHGIEQSLGIKAYDIYGLTEVCGPGVAFECSEQHGMHINEDHFYAEIIDPETGEILPEGSKGELVFSSLTKKAFPLLRYRTKDIAVLTTEKCACGRTLMRMTKPLGRTDDMLIIKGVNVFPSQIETVLLEQGYAPNYQIVVDRIGNKDTFDIYVELSPAMFTDTVKGIADAEKALVGAMDLMLGVNPRIHLVAPNSIERSEGKAKRVIDKRKLIG